MAVVINGLTGIDLGTPLVATEGGTGLTSPGTAGNVLTSDGTGWTSSPVDATILKSADIGVTVQGYDATTLKSSAIGVTVQAYDADLAAFAAKSAPTGDVVGTSDTQTLTNKTIGMAGALDCNNNVIQEIKTATFNSQNTITTTSGSITVDWTVAQNQKQNEPTGTITYTFTAPPGPCHLQLIIDSDGTSTAQTINWPGSVVFMGSAWAGVNNKKAVINFWYDGTNYIAVGTNQV